MSEIIPFWGHFEHTAKKNTGNADYYCFSNWAKSEFQINNRVFYCTEQYLMYKKAIQFGDKKMAKKIRQYISEDDWDKTNVEWNNLMKDIKKMGRQVKDFDEEVWKQVRQEIMFKGLWAKFSQNKHMKKVLLSTKNKILAEAAPRDRIWGIGMGSRRHAWLCLPK